MKEETKIILFVDFDGVLHPIFDKPSGTNFCKLPLLEDWLRTHQHVQVVISSSWRTMMDLEDLRHIFSKDLRSRIIGKCPSVSIKPAPDWLRFEEIMQWTTTTCYTGLWLALDDAIEEFPDDYYPLIACDPQDGINEVVINELTAKFNHFSTLNISGSI